MLCFALSVLPCLVYLRVPRSGKAHLVILLPSPVGSAAAEPPQLWFYLSSESLYHPMGQDCSLQWQPLVLFDLWSGQSTKASCPSDQYICGLGLATTETASYFNSMWAHGKRLEVGCACPWAAVISRCEGGVEK